MQLCKLKVNCHSYKVAKVLLNVIGIVCCTSLHVSCSGNLGVDDPDESTFETCYTRSAIEDASRTISDCGVCVRNNQLTIISKERAQQRGVGVQDYDKLRQSVDEANRLLSKIVTDLENQGYNVEVYDMSTDSECDIASYVETLATGEDSDMPSGVIETYDGTKKTVVHFAPPQQTGVTANCIAHVALCPLHTVTTTYAGGNAKVGTAFGPGNKTITVPISMSNTNFGISYQTSDSNGGKCVWRGISGN